MSVEKKSGDKKVSPLGWVTLACSVAVLFFPAEPDGYIWIPGSLSLFLAGLLLIKSRRESVARITIRQATSNYLHPGVIISLSSIVLSLGFFVLPLAVHMVPILPESISFMALPFLACIVLIGIHTYLGIHVITREVIFVDLSIAQMAALGAAFAFILGYSPASNASYTTSLAFTFLGAGIFASSRMREREIPQEAIIGIVYAFASALTILVISRAPHGAEHIKEMLTGSILWVRAETIVQTARVYSVISIFHIVLYRVFVLISRDPSRARSIGMQVMFWDLLFYLSFGIVITFAVATAGVLLVFSFLIIPAFISALFTDNTVQRLLIGWAIGTVVSVVGLMLSYTLDFSSGPAVVSLFGLSLVLAALLRVVMVRMGPKR